MVVSGPPGLLRITFFYLKSAGCICELHLQNTFTATPKLVSELLGTLDKSTHKTDHHKYIA